MPLKGVKREEAFLTDVVESSPWFNDRWRIDRRTVGLEPWSTERTNEPTIAASLRLCEKPRFEALNCSAACWKFDTLNPWDHHLVMASATVVKVVQKEQ